jgi:protein-S-isoprenylcysteine O-methyltransferase Ste14
MSHEHDNPGVIAAPPLIYGAGIVIGLLLNTLIPLPFISATWQTLFSMVLVVTGLGLGLWAILTMRNKGTSPVPEHPTTAIVSEGPFAFSRNPIYLGFTLITLGFAAWVNTAWIVIVLIGVLAVMHYGVIFREERYLARKFGDEYLQYKAKVRRWI